VLAQQLFTRQQSFNKSVANEQVTDVSQRCPRCESERVFVGTALAQSP
jgi:hypothetical protein